MKPICRKRIIHISLLLAVLAFFLVNILQAGNRIKKAETEGTKLAIAMGMEPEAGFAIGHQLLELPRVKGVTREKVASVMKALTPIASTGEATPETIGRLAAEAFDISTVTGVDALDVANMMVAYKTGENIPLNQLASKVLKKLS